MPVPMDTPGDVLRGRIRHLEHHGHETLAFVDVGATAVVIDEIAASNGKPAGTQTRGLRKLVDRWVSGPTRPQETPPPEAGRHHRRPAELVVRLAPYPAINAGHPLAIAVRIDALHFFEEGGNRIDIGRR
jgi:multiple sugar transport system ATP-binding protein